VKCRAGLGRRLSALARPDKTEIEARKTVNTSFEGVYAIMVTPFSDDASSVDIDGLQQVADTLIAEGVRILTPCGNTGEFHTLSEAEKRRIITATVEVARGRADVVAGVGGPLEDVIAQVRHCAAVGATAVMVHYPPHPFLTDEGIASYFTSVATATSLPVIPYVRGTELSQEGALRVTSLSNVVAVKYAVRNPVAFGDLVAAAAGRTEARWICGVAESWAPAFWAVGSHGFTSGLINVTARLPLRLFEQLQAGDMAGALETWRLVRPFERLRSQRADGNNVAVVKEAMRQLGRPAGPVRPPSSELNAVDRSAVSAILATFETAVLA